MEVTFRPVSDQFLEEIAFPIFEMGMVDGQLALERLARVVADDHTRSMVELVKARTADRAGIWELDPDSWIDAMYRLIFSRWTRTPQGWVAGRTFSGYVAPLKDALHLALMIEHPRYPYWEKADCEMLIDACIANPEPELGLAALLAGGWDPSPMFAPHEVLRLSDRGLHKDGSTQADWAVRQRTQVAVWAQQLPQKLGRLLKREQVRLKPLEMPDADAVLAYWLGEAAEPPLVGVAFSGLGPEASTWVRDLGAIVAQLRHAAKSDLGLSAIITSPKPRLEESPFGP